MTSEQRLFALPQLAGAALLFTAYALTCAPDLTFYDSPELALVAYQLGVGHPAGQPLHTLIGWLFAHLPGLSAHAGLTLLSALAGTACAGLVWWWVEALVGPPRTRTEAWLRVIALVGLGLSPIAWGPSTRVEVYTLAAALSLGGLVAASRARGMRGAAIAGGILGLAGGCHLVLGAAATLGAVLLLGTARAVPPDDAHPGSFGRGISSRSALCATAAIGALVSYAYVPLAASDPRIFAWGAPNDPTTLFAYLRGADYVHNQGITLSAFVQHLGAMAWSSARNGSLPLAVGGALAIVAIRRRPPGLMIGVVCVALVDLGFVAANVVFHPDIPDYSGYYLTPFWLTGGGLVALAARTHQRGGRFRSYGAIFALLPMLALAAGAEHLASRRDDPSLARALARGAMQEAEPGAVLVMAADHWVAPLLFVQEAEGLRPDVVLLPLGLASSSWYWEHLYTRHPELTRFALRGPGGRLGRVRRFIDTHPSRPVRVESWSIATSLGLRPACVGWLLTTAGSCEDSTPSAATRAIDATAPLRGEALEVAARVGEARGEALWRLGYGRAAVGAWLAGFAGSGIGPAVDVANLPSRGPPLTGALPSWSRPAALHDPARNLALVGLLFDALGARREATMLIDRALLMGLDGALDARLRLEGPPPGP